MVMPPFDRALPHFHVDGMTQFVTLRLFDAIPPPLRLRSVPETAGGSQPSPREIEAVLDQGYGECLLGLPQVAACAASVLQDSSGAEYDLYAWVFMPNHAHLLLTPRPPFHIQTVMQRYKSRSTVQINRLLSRTGAIWQRGYFDKYIRDAEHFDRAVDYIHRNPVKAGLAVKIEEWRSSSAYGMDASGLEFSGGEG